MDVQFDAVIHNQNQFEPDKRYYPVSKRLYVREEDMRDAGVVGMEARNHPHGITYYAPAATRAVVHAYERPGSVVSGFSALALYGLPFLVEGADTTLLAQVRRNTPATQSSPALRRPTTAPLERRTLTHRGVTIQAVSPRIAVIQALSQIKRGEHRWTTVNVEGFEAVDVMAVQLVDCARQFFGLTCEELAAAGKNRIERRWLQRVLNNSSALAESPKETELRLKVEALLRGYDYELKEQWVFTDQGRIVTRFDLAIPELKIGVMYDGEHHLKRSQRDKDALINLTSTLHGWTVIRCSFGTMEKALEVLAQFLERAAP